MQAGEHHSFAGQAIPLHNDALVATLADLLTFVVCLHGKGKPPSFDVHEPGRGVDGLADPGPGDVRDFNADPQGHLIVVEIRGDGLHGRAFHVSHHGRCRIDQDALVGDVRRGHIPGRFDDPLSFESGLEFVLH